MAHRLYHTEGIVLASRPLGEDSRVFLILTPDCGLANVLARGVRKTSSKLRSHMQTMVHLRLSLVRGREFWRLAGAEDTGDLIGLWGQSQKAAAAQRLSGLVRRLVSGEEGHPAFYREFKESLLFLARSDFNPVGLKDFQLVVAVRLLRHLGYIAQSETTIGFTLVPHSRRVATRLIREALNSSQL